MRVYLNENIFETNVASIISINTFEDIMTEIENEVKNDKMQTESDPEETQQI